MKYKDKVAIIYQAEQAPEKDGIIKPMKSGGYSDSGADIAYSLRKQSIEVATPVDFPDVDKDLEWVFPDTAQGIEDAINQGATVIWLNTVLYKGHPIEQFMSSGIWCVGQLPSMTEIYDDKLATNSLLRRNNLPVPDSITIFSDNTLNYNLKFQFPVVIKPIRGRGSQGVMLVDSKSSLDRVLNKMFDSKEYGNVVYVEQFLSGEEITITVMPPGKYYILGAYVDKTNYWSLSPVRRFNHNNGIAPYNGTVAVIQNSEILSDKEIDKENVQAAIRQCESAASIIQAKAPIRIDCRSDKNGKFFLFDLNMKPNMTGPSRPHRLNQDSLTAIAARKIGWDFDLLVFNLLMQKWQ